MSEESRAIVKTAVTGELKELNGAQLAALRHCAAINGRKWKSALRLAWETGRYVDAGCADVAPELQQVRNTLGPNWLVRFRLEVR